MFGPGMFVLAPDMSHSGLLERAQMKNWFRIDGSENDPLRDVPHPTDDNGNKLPHGAVLDFAAVPIRLQPRKALVWWLRLHHVNIPLDYPMEVRSPEITHTHTNI